LEDNKDKLTELAEVLLEKEVIFKDNLEKIFGRRPFEKDVIADAEKDKKADAEKDKKISSEEE
jgi:cell division protease FtsH